MPLLGKLYVTANSSMEKLQAAKALAAEAIDMNIVGDAASRNGLNKFHTAIVKVIGDSLPDRGQVDEETAVDLMPEEKLVVVGESDTITGGSKTEALKTEGNQAVQDSLLDELLEDDVTSNE